MTTEVVNIKKTDDYDVYIGRSHNGNGHMLNISPTEKGWLGNPFPVGKEYSRKESIKEFKKYFKNKLENNPEFRREVKKLKGKTLGCFCKPKPCHGDVIKKYLDSLED